MAKKTDQPEEQPVYDATDPNKPWEKQFDDDRDDDGNLSRVANRKKQRGNRTLVWVVSILLIALIISPILYQVFSSSQSSQTPDDKITVETSSKVSSKAKSSSSKEKSKSSSERSSVASTTSSSIVSSSSSQAPASSSASSTPSSSSSSQATAGNTYVVKAGDNPYRIAVNHGMTLSELYALNGLSQGSTVTPGMSLKVK
ncbi:SAG1386/EF1546 family surface-associated protein [Lacticaseibacillus brantae]|uniref:LysM domain-containing protein n=1 Tax=Lacticaseibacillus brantae DSM 23927 TaxID=1423727 RepID=A0A0R2AZN8_9LACO|nr:SAG1386/EF1546 family surface-associated protein [Lacticaseibacillus brantae]KRM72599.1 hypothetical protein FC34_GL000308 [Lacticaseibacillus brantae DSM 23927]